jgi:hypothetical protein
MKNIENILIVTNEGYVYLRHHLKEVTLYPQILVRTTFKLFEPNIR